MKIPLPNEYRWKYSLLISLVFFTCFTATAQIRSGNSYINLSKRTIGGTVQPGDTLEIRTNYYIPTGFNSNNLYWVRYLDNIPSNTEYIGDSLRLITNEGLTYKRWTNAAGDDAAAYIAAPPAGHFNIRINIGNNASAPLNNSVTDQTGAGLVKPDTHKPRVGAGMLITTAFKVRVTGSVGQIITLGEGRLRYRTRSSSGTNVDILATPYKILIADNDPICNNSIGKNFVAEAGGTFDSSNTQNRPYGPTFLIPGYTYRTLTSGTPIGDGYYTIVNNLSPRASTFQAAQKRPNCVTSTGPASCVNRMFDGHWDIIGDHTGSTTPAGNLPEAPGSTGGYMLVVNADYATSEAYRQNITGLCPNTSYEFSLWVRNVCTNCGIDSSGNSTFKPGVLPNLTFAIDDLDRYSSGQIDTVGWIKKGFLFKTGPSQTDITISIRNNASGGGGNDWAIDDIALVTCNPALELVPSGNSNVCFGNQVDVSCTVQAFFNNYTNYRWERSTDGGATWNVTGSGTGTPVLVNGVYQYTASLPSFIADESRHLNQYRFVVASSAANLSNPDCAFAASTVITVQVNDCQDPLITSLVSFNGKLKDNNAELSWKVLNESAAIIYQVERSTGNGGFIPVGRIPGKGIINGQISYSFTDPLPVSGMHSYRIRMIEANRSNMSRIIMISNPGKLIIRSLINPFTDKIRFEVHTSIQTDLIISIFDNFGRLIRSQKQMVARGGGLIQINDLAALPKSAYILRIEANGEIINRKVLKN